MFGGAVLLIVLGLDGSLGLFDGSLLLGLLMAYTAFLVRQSRAEPAATGPDEYADTLQPAKAGRWDARLPAQLGLIVAGLVIRLARDRLGGQTGDVLGSVAICAETAILAAMAVHG